LAGSQLAGDCSSSIIKLAEKILLSADKQSIILIIMEVPDSGSDDEKVQPVAEVDDLSAESEKYDSAEEGITSVVLVVEGKKLHYTREVCMLETIKLIPSSVACI